MKTKRRIIYWDSNVFIDLLKQEPQRFPDLRRIVEDAAAGNSLIVTSALSIAEVCKIDGSPQDQEAQAETIRKLFESEYIEVRPIDRAIVNEASRIGRVHGSKPYDSIHVATALSADIEVFYTYDGQQRGPNPKRKKVYLISLDGKITWQGKSGHRPLAIHTPEQYFSSLPLFNQTSPTHALPSVLHRKSVMSLWWLNGRVRKCASHPLRMQSAVSMVRNPLPRSIPACRLP